MTRFPVQLIFLSNNLRKNDRLNHISLSVDENEFLFFDDSVIIPPNEAEGAFQHSENLKTTSNIDSTPNKNSPTKTKIITYHERKTC